MAVILMILILALSLIEYRLLNPRAEMVSG
jgi:hypothetical protein